MNHGRWSMFSFSFVSGLALVMLAILIFWLLFLIFFSLLTCWHIRRDGTVYERAPILDRLY